MRVETEPRPRRAARALVLLLATLLALLSYGAAMVRGIPSAAQSAEPANLLEVPISTASEWQGEPAIAYNPTADEYLIVWQDRRAVTNWDIRARRGQRPGRGVGRGYRRLLRHL